MFCAQCGASLQPDASFCATCGAAVTGGQSAQSGMGAPGYSSVETGTRYAGFWIRFGSLIIDGVILGVVNLILTVPLRGSGVGTLVSLVISAAYYIYCLSQWNGQTIGARAVGIKLVDVNGGLASVNAASIRWALANIASMVITLGVLAGSPALIALSFLVWLAQIAGYLVMLGDPNKQTFYDRMAGTYVIYVNPSA